MPLPSSTGDIAIIGMSCRVAGAESPSELWDLLATSKDVRKEIDRFNSAGYYKANGAKRKGLTNVRHAYLMDQGIDRFDNGYFSVPASEAVAMDPQQRMLLELSYEAVESAGLPLKDFQGTNTAVYCGLFTNDYGTSLLRDIDATPKYHSTGTSNSIAANRISYFYDLHGPSMVIDTACSSTMVALHQAVLSLKANEAAMALVCGANLILNPDMFVHMSELGFLSPDGRCKSFDASGDGYARGEGVLALLLKPLDKAIEHGDPIRSVIRGTRINQDGRTNGITLPSSKAQTENLRALYDDHGLLPVDVQYLEAHGTGTAVGDPLEMSAIDAIFADSTRAENLIVGSVKSNVGHLEACAALIGIIKTVECLERGQIPPQMHFIDPNPEINFDNTTIPTTMMDWPESGLGFRRAAVNSFGFGGTNGHVVLDYYPTKSRTLSSTRRPYLFKVSAATDTALGALALSYADYVERQTPPLGDLAHTLLARRSTLKKSIFLTASDHSELTDALKNWDNGASGTLSLTSVATRTVGFVFTGQGAQWAEMGKQLIASSATFATIVDKCDDFLASLQDGPAWKIREEICKPPKVSNVNDSRFSQPLCTALQLGLVEVWKEWGVTPRAVFGHSSGEVAAAYAADILSLRDAIVIAYYRGLYMGTGNSTDSLGPKGAMCAVGLSETESANLLKPYSGRAVIAAINSPSSCTLSGDQDAILEVLETSKERGFFCRALRVDMAYHSHHMWSLAPGYEQALHDAGISSLAPSAEFGCEMISSVTKQKLSSSDCTPEYWAKNMVSPVQFSAALTETMRLHDIGVLVELGPHPALKGPALDTLAVLGKSDIAYFGSCVRNQPGFDSILGTVGQMVSAGLPILTDVVNSTEHLVGSEVKLAPGRVLTDLPKYQWDHSVSHWAETRLSRNHRFRKFPRHQLLGARVHDDTPLNPKWINRLMLKEIGWLEDMMAAGETVMPKSAYILMALEAAEQIYYSEHSAGAFVRLEEIQFLQDLPLVAMIKDDGIIEIHFNLYKIAGSKDVRFTVSAAASGAKDTWEEHCNGIISLCTTAQAMPVRRQPPAHDPSILENMELSTLFPKSRFQSFNVEIDYGSGDFISRANVDDHYHIDPTILSSVMQVPAMLLTGCGLPAEHQLDSIEVLELPLGGWTLENGKFDAKVSQKSPIRSSTDVQIYDDDGHYISLKGVWSRVHRPLQRNLSLQSLFYKPEVLTDITFLESAEALSVARLVELVTHKWPMCDIGVTDVSSTDLQAVCSHMKGFKDHERPRFRSFTVQHEEAAVDVGRLRKVKAFSKEAKFHLLISGAQRLLSFDSHIHNNGLACARIDSRDDQEVFDVRFDFICKIQGFEGGNWALGRVKLPSNGVTPARKLTIIGSDGYDIDFFRPHGEFEYFQLQKQNVRSFCEGQKLQQDPYDLIVLDCGQKSMLVDWEGHDLLPWIKSVLDRVLNLLWVTHEVDASPFSNVAGSFVRTLQSEHPSLKAASLVIQGSQDPSSLATTVLDVYDRMTHQGNEVELFAKGMEVCALRYIPDDELSAFVGIIPPRVSEGMLGTSNYELSLKGPCSAVVRSSRDNKVVSADHASLYVKVKASILDFDDIATFADVHPQKASWNGLGQFLLGTVRSDGHSELTSGTVVVGWQPGAHASILQVPSRQLRRVPEGMTAAEAVAHYATYAMAFTTICGAARAREFETIHVDLPDCLAEAFTHVCRLLDIRFATDARTEADFVVSFESTRGLLVNGRRVSLKTFMISDDSVQCLDSIMSDCPRLRCSPSQFAFREYQDAFEATAAGLGISVLIHSNVRDLRGHLMTYTPAEKLFRSDGAYVIIGGLGGLGRYLLTWMVAKGASHLVIISRSGGNSQDAEQTMAMIRDLGATIQVYKADACNAEAVSQVTIEVRKERPIRGCLNMALVLDNSPIMTMNGSQWDRALRSKVDSTWNLHQATLVDELDLFIMFSSISSISGNRTQANYATGNSFQNTMAAYRKSLGLPGVSVALGAMSGIGVLADDHDLLRTLSQSGLKALHPDEFTKIIEAAVLESRHGDRYLLSTGFEMFETLDDVVQAKPEQNQLFWTEWPEFGFLMDHKYRTTGAVKSISLREQLEEQNSDAAHETLLRAFLLCLSSVLGYEVANFDPTSSLASYGVDSLNAVSCRYWFFKELKIDVPVFDILGCRSIKELISRVQKKLKDQSRVVEASLVVQPKKHDKENLAVRPISRSQSRLWFLHRFLPDKTIYNLLLVCHISGKVNVNSFAETWSIFLQRHEILHTRIVNTAEGLQQIPQTNPTFTMQEVEATEETFQAQVELITIAARSFVFDLDLGELVRGWLLKSPQGWRFFLSSHHIAWDRNSVPTIFDEITSIYKSLTKGEPGGQSLPPVPYQFIDYTLWQEACMDKPELVQTHSDYWKTQLNGIPEAVSLLPMALVKARPLMKQYDVRSRSLDLGSSLATKMKGFCKTKAVTPFMFLASALTALIHRFTGDSDIVIGIADGDRGHTEFDRLVGFTVNMLAIRSRLSTDMPYTVLLENYRNACLEAYEHREIPFDYLLQQLEIPRRTSHSPLFQVVINYQMQGAFPECDFGDFRFTDYDHYNAKSQSDFMLDVEETLVGDLHCVFSFDTSLYDDAAMSSLTNAYKVLIENILAVEGQATLNSIGIVPGEDQEFIASVLQPSFANGSSLRELNSSLFPTLFRKAASTHPSKEAVIDDARTLTWKDLDIATNRVARFLLDSGAEAGESIGICCEGGADMIIAMYGVILAGCVYVPIDPDFPEERVSYMVEDTKVERVLVDVDGGKPYQRLIACGILLTNIHLIGELATDASNESTLPLDRQVAATDAFCCIFTSGSTGRPKGIYLGHAQLRYQMEGYHARIGTNCEDRILLSSAMVFDMSLTSIYGTILHGATVVIASREARYKPAKLVEQLIESRVSNCTFTTTQLKVLLTAVNKNRLVEWTSLRSMVIGGEQIPPWVVRDFFGSRLPNAAIFNGYAPAETTVCNSLRQILPEDAKKTEIPLERPLFPARFHILDENMASVPVGISGELYIGGPTVNNGYINRDEITSAVFLQDPFATPTDLEEGNGKLYRTGDSFRLVRDGTIQALGRIGGQRQVKIRGMRTELDEIESVIYDALQVVEDFGVCPIGLVAVVYHQTSKDEGLLTAYLAALDGAENDENNETQRRSLKAFLQVKLKAILPVHMNPTAFVFVPHLPQMVSGKIDYKTLLTWEPPAPETSILSGIAMVNEPLNQLQAVIAGVWKHVLHFEGELSSADEFFALGGHSLILPHIQEGIQKECGAVITLADMFGDPTIGGMEKLIIAQLGSEQDNTSGKETSGATTAIRVQGPSRQFVDWEKECSLENADWYVEPRSTRSASVVALTGACTMAGAHFIHQVLTESDIRVFCIATEAPTADVARSKVIDNLKHWRLFDGIAPESLPRLQVYNGSLSHPTLGLTAEQVDKLDREVQAIYQLDSEVSLLKRYENLRASNVGSLQFLVSLAHGKVNNTKAIHYLSTWGVPHLQAWNETELSTADWLTTEVEMTHMKPGADGTLGYLKARWACESILYHAAQRGIPVHIFRSCMCGGSPASGVPLARTDINRRILEGSLHVGAVPDFNSVRGGGMSWITADFLIRSLLHLSQCPSGAAAKARIHHIVSDTHIPYTELASILKVSHAGEKMVTVTLEEWFEKLRSCGNLEMSMQADVLESWCAAGWVPFALEAKETLDLLRREKELVPPKIDRDMLLKLVIGDEGF